MDLIILFSQVNLFLFVTQIPKTHRPSMEGFYSLCDHQLVACGLNPASRILQTGPRKEFNVVRIKEKI